MNGITEKQIKEWIESECEGLCDATKIKLEELEAHLDNDLDRTETQLRLRLKILEARIDKKIQAVQRRVTSLRNITTNLTKAVDILEDHRQRSPRNE